MCDCEFRNHPGSPCGSSKCECHPEVGLSEEAQIITIENRAVDGLGYTKLDFMIVVRPISRGKALAILDRVMEMIEAEDVTFHFDQLGEDE